MKTIILADGVSKEAHLSDRHFIEIGGEPLLTRSVRQFAAFSDVVVIASDLRYNDELRDEPCTVTAGDGKLLYYQADMIRKGLMHRDGLEPCLIVFGDVYFTDTAVAIIATGDFGKAPFDWAVYGRSTNNPHTGTPWAEYFAIELGSVLTTVCRRALKQIRHHYMNKQWGRCSPWEWYYEMEGMPYRIENTANVPTGLHWVEINDLTDDVDFQQDAANLNKALDNGG